MKIAISFAAAVLVSGYLSQATAAIIPFDLLGKAGPGLLAGNETGAVSGTAGVGGELGTGILFNDFNLQLAINVGWGTGNGFATNLTGDATIGHIHGPTASGGTASFNQNAGTFVNFHQLPGWNASASNGGFNGTVTLTAPQATALLEGKLYLNFHTTANGGGEIRGNMVAVPEPSSAALLAGGLGMVLGFRRRRS